MVTEGAETCPPLVIFTVPVLSPGPKPDWKYPMLNEVPLVHFEPAPSTTTVLTVPLAEKSLTNAALSMTWPPCWIKRPVMLVGLSTKNWLLPSNWLALLSTALALSRAASHSVPAPVTVTTPVAPLPLVLAGVSPPIEPPSLTT